jgi:hypothetical protein
MKIPELASAELTELLTMKASLARRAQASSEKVHSLRALKTEGQNNIDNKESRIAIVLSGKDIPASNDVDAQLTTEMLQWESINEAQQVIDKQIRTASYKAATALCKSLKPEHDKIMVRLASSLLDVLKAHAELFSLKQQLIDNGSGLVGICLLMPSFLDAPNNRYSPLAEFLRAAKAENYISAVPKELQ